MMRAAVLVSGGGTNLQALLDAQIPGVEFALVVSNRKKAYALERARLAGIEGVYLPTVRYDRREDYHTALRDLLIERRIDAVLLAGFLVVLGKPVMEAFAGRILNIHPSLIPSFCGDGFYGLKVHEEVLRRGVKVTGATAHFVDEGTDTGPIIFQKAVDVEPDDTPETLQQRVMEQAEWVIFPKAVALFAAGRLKIEDGRVRILEEKVNDSFEPQSGSMEVRR